MKTLGMSVISGLIILLLAGGTAFEPVYAQGHKGCLCCSSKCQGAAKCHDSANKAAKACSCNFQTARAALPCNNIFPRPALTGYLAQNARFVYHYRFCEDVFHPPRA